MKTIFLAVFITFISFSLLAKSNLDYFMPDNVTFNPNIPTPFNILGYEVGEWMVSHDQLINYLKIIEKSTDRAKLIEYGKTYENRPLFQMIFSTPKNLDRLEDIRIEHMKLSDPNLSGSLDIEQMPLVVLLGYSVHGNEASGVNASLLLLYYLAAAEGKKIDQLMENTIIIVDPALNPDGINRFSNWANMHKSQSKVVDPNSRIFNEVWPGGRTNHYWFDLNRDYILLTNPESKGRVEQIQKWLPNIVTDHHEMGANSTFFFQPGVPNRVNLLTPEKNQILTKKIGDYHSKFLDNIGSLYFSEEVFDDYYFGKGSSYPDINSGIGILFEQASTRGFQQETVNGIMDFPFTIKNQFTVSLSTLEAAFDMRIELLQYQKEFFDSAFDRAEKNVIKAYVFGGINDKGRIFELLKILKTHNIKIYHIKEDINIDNKLFTKENSFIIPLKQANTRLIESFFKVEKYFKDSTFYDVSSWNMAMSFNLLTTEIKDKKQLDKLMGHEMKVPNLEGNIINESDKVVAWVFEWNEYYAPRALSEILSLGIRAKVGQKPFTYNDGQINKHFSYGTILIPAHDQYMNQEELYQKLKTIAKRDGLNLYSLKSALTYEGIDLGSSYFSNLKIPKISMLVEGDVNSRDAGEIWHLFDTRYLQPITMLEVDQLRQVNLNDYNVVILPGGSYNGLSANVVEKIKEWVNDGGVLISYKSTNWVSNTFKLDIKFKEPPKIGKVKPVYGTMFEDANVQYISGAIFETELDLTHPLAYGYTNSTIPVFKTGLTVAELTDNPYVSPIRYTKNPLLSGYCTQENIDRIKESPFLFIHSFGNGKIISIIDNTNFRGVWYGSNKIFTNAVFFGHLIQLGPRWFEAD